MLVLVLVTCSLTGVFSEESEDDLNNSNASYYTTSEMRDMCLQEWAGKTQEVQQYFDQLPSAEFKENSEDLKFMHYYEKKGIKDLESGQVFNITPEFHTPSGPEYTIEVNDTHVPKYRVTTSEEERIDKYGTFNSMSSSSEGSDEPLKKKPKESSEPTSGSEPSDSGGKKSSKKKKKRKGKKNWPDNMDPSDTSRPKKKKKKRVDAVDKKRKELVERTLNGMHPIRMKNKPNLEHRNFNVPPKGNININQFKNKQPINIKTENKKFKPYEEHTKEKEILNTNHREPRRRLRQEGNRWNHQPWNFV